MISCTTIYSKKLKIKLKQSWEKGCVGDTWDRRVQRRVGGLGDMMITIRHDMIMIFHHDTDDDDDDDSLIIMILFFSHSAARGFYRLVCYSVFNCSFLLSLSPTSISYWSTVNERESRFRNESHIQKGH